MIDYFANLFSFEFMRNALLAGMLVSVACGIVGALVVLNRIVFISGGIAHASYGGVGLAYYFGQDPMLGAILFSIFSSLAMGLVHRKTRARSDTIIGVMWAIGMAIGIIFISLTPGYKSNLMSFLFGSILAVSTADLWLMAAIAILSVAFVALAYRALLAISFDEDFAAVRNVAVTPLYLLMIVLIGLAVVVSMRVVGLIMIIALLTIPAAIANLFFKDMRIIMVVGVSLSMIFSTAGLIISYALNLQTGAVIILTAGLAYLLATLVKMLSNRLKPQIS